jgi:hypothetical protein
MRHPAAAALAAALALAVPAAAQAAGAGENIRHVANVEYPNLFAPNERNAGTDIEFAEIDGRQYAVAGSYGDGTHIIDITDPEAPVRVSTWECGVSQADPQVFTRDDMPGRTFITTTMDDGYTFHRTSKCNAELRAKGITVRTDGYGTFIADITDPENPETVGFIPVKKESADGLSEGASHNGTVHPSGKYFYNSNSDLMTSVLTRPPAIEVFDITDFAKPVLVDEIELKVLPGLGTESHDLTFNEDGTRAYTAALSHAAVIDTTDPTNNKNIGTIVDPAINVWHQSDPVTIKDPLLGERTFLVVEDEVAGALGTGQCPNGGVHVYDITGDLEKTPVKVGYWNIDDVDATDREPGTFGLPLSCTAHVFDIHEDEALMTIAYYNGGVRVVDLSNLVGVSLGKAGVGMKELGYYRFKGGSDFSDTWAVKAPFVSRDGFYLYGNDQNRAFDVYEYKPQKATLEGSKDRWLKPHELLKAQRLFRLTKGQPQLAAVCLLGSKGERELQRAARGTGLKLPKT